MSIELYKQQSLDLFKRFEIAVPQKKTEPVLQVGNEYNYKFIKFAPDATYIACAAFSREGMVIIRQFPSGKHLMQHRYKSFLNGFSDISDSNHAILWFEDRENYLVKFPEGDILYAFSGFVYNVVLCGDKQTFFIQNEDEYFLFKSKEEIIHLGPMDKKIRDVQISNNMAYALIIYENKAEVFSLSEGTTLYTIEEYYKIYDVSISPDSRYFVYSARDKEVEGCLKTIEIATGNIVSEMRAVLHSPEFLPFSQGWILDTGRLAVYYPDSDLLKELQVGYTFKEVIENQYGKFLLRLKSYRDNEYIERTRFEVYNLDNLYNAHGEPNPLLQVDIPSRSACWSVSPDKKMVAVCYIPSHIEIYSTTNFKLLNSIDLARESSPLLLFSSCSKYLLVNTNSQLTIYDTQNFNLVNTTLTAIKSYCYNKSEGVFALTDSLNALQIRQIKDGNLVYSIPADDKTREAIAVSDKKVWTTRYNGEYYYPEVIDLQNRKTISYHGAIHHFKQIEGNYLICKSGIINTKTGDLIPVANFEVLFDNSYFYSFKQYAVKVNCYAIDVYENITGILIKKIAPPAGKEFGDNLTLCGQYIIYETKYAQETYIQHLFNNEPPVQLFNQQMRKIEKIDDRFFLITNYRVKPDITDVFIFDTQLQLAKPIKEYALEGNLYYSAYDGDKQQIALFSSKIGWYINLINPETFFAIRQEDSIGVLFFDNIVVLISANNKLNYYNTVKNQYYQTGDLLATLYTIPDGFLWVTPPDQASPNGWFWTNHPEYIEVMQYMTSKKDYELLPQSSNEWKKYIELHNREDLVIARLNNPEAYRQNLSDLQGKIQHLHIEKYKHTLMLNSSI